MNLFSKLLLAAIALTSITVYSVYRNYQKQVAARFPDVDRKIARKAYRNMLRNCFDGTYPDIQDYDDAQMDELFLKEVQKLQNQ